MSDINMTIKIVPEGRRGKLLSLLELSRFHTFSPIYSSMPGAWSVLLAGASKLKSANSEENIGQSSQLVENPEVLTPGFIFQTTVLFLLSSYLLCAAGNVWNDLIDRNIDRGVARTKDRPIPSGRVTPVEAVLWMFFQALVSGLIINTCFDRVVTIYSLPSLLGTIIYPFTKRPTARKLRIYPQFILGYALASAMFAGRATILGEEETFLDNGRQTLPLFAVVFLWEIYENTAYSYQDVLDDTRLRVNQSYTAFGVANVHLFLVVMGCLTLSALGYLLIGLGSAWLWWSWMGVWGVTFFVQMVWLFDAKKPATGGTVSTSHFPLSAWALFACVVEVLRSGPMTG